MDRLLRLREVIACTGMGKSTIYRKIGQGPMENRCESSSSTRTVKPVISKFIVSTLGMVEIMAHFVQRRR
jgi:hypothetical protein